MPWKSENERHSDDMIDAIERAAHSINHTLLEGFKLLALQIARSQGAAPDNSQAIHDMAQNLRRSADSLRKSLPQP